MSVLSYLESVSSGMVLTSNEQNSISISINNLSSKAKAHFGSDVVEQFRFGSSTRDTILPRKYDDESDIDYMLIFGNHSNYKPQTLLNWLRDFIEKYYSRSEIYQSHPTIVLELSHIKFELVPAMRDAGGVLSIPSSGFSEWMATDPNGFNQLLTTKNVLCNYKIKPLVRLMKYWNVQKAGKGFLSFGLEQWIVANSYNGCTNLKEYLFRCIDDLQCSSDAPQYLNEAVAHAKQIIANVRQYERGGNASFAEREIKKLIPEL